VKLFVNAGITLGKSDDYRNARLTNSSSSEIRFFVYISENHCLAQKASISTSKHDACMAAILWKKYERTWGSFRQYQRH